MRETYWTLRLPRTMARYLPNLAQGAVPYAAGSPLGFNGKESQRRRPRTTAFLFRTLASAFLNSVGEIILQNLGKVRKVGFILGWNVSYRLARLRLERTASGMQ